MQEIHPKPNHSPLQQLHLLQLVTKRTSNYQETSKSTHQQNYKISPQAVLQIQKVNMANVVELKVGLHCDECIKKILKTIKKIEDIETYDIDTKLNKVTVTGNVTTEEVIRVLNKIGKQPSVWDEDSANHIPN